MKSLQILKNRPLLLLTKKESEVPHCIVEYSSGLEERVSPLMRVVEVFQGALDSDLFNVHDIKSRAIAYENHKAGSGVSDFVHVTVKILSGRTAQQRGMLSATLLSRLKGLNLLSVSLSVEVVDMERETYANVVL